MDNISTFRKAETLIKERFSGNLHQKLQLIQIAALCSGVCDVVVDPFNLEALKYVYGHDPLLVVEYEEWFSEEYQSQL